MYKILLILPDKEISGFKTSMPAFFAKHLITGRNAYLYIHENNIN